MDGPLAPEPGDGRYFLVGVLAIVVVVLGIVVVNHPGVGPGRTVDFLLHKAPTALQSAPSESTAP